MVETTADYANAADGVDNMGYAVDVEPSRRTAAATTTTATKQTKQPNLQHEHQLEQRQYAERDANKIRRNVKPVIHFPEPPAESPSNCRYVNIRTTL